MEHLVESLMETMWGLGSRVGEIVRAVEELAPRAVVVPEEPAPEKQDGPVFPAYYYHKATRVVEAPPQAVRMPPLPQMPYRSVSYDSPLNTPKGMRWLNYSPPPVPYVAPPDPGGQCRCGHPWEEHAPACVHLIEGCYCEVYHPVNAGVEG